MKITLAAVRKVTSDTFGSESFISSLITDVVEKRPTKRGTASITRDGILSYNPKFVEEYVETPNDLACLILHELFHPLYNHCISYGENNRNIENIAQDAIINSLLSVVYPRVTDYCSLPRKFYPDSFKLVSLLRPGSQYIHSTRYGPLYSNLYSNDSDINLTTSDVITTLKLLASNSSKSDNEDDDKGVIIFLGSHGNSNNENEENNDEENDNNDEENDNNDDDKSLDSDPEIISKIAQDIKNSIFNLSNGYSPHHSPLLKQFLSILDTHISMRKNLLTNFLTKRIFGNFTKPTKVPKLNVSPIPLNPTKRDIVLMASGCPSFNYHYNSTSIGKKGGFGLVVYLDVSGSVWGDLPHIINILKDIKNEVETIFTFSTEVVKISMDDLVSGKLQTSGGTSFNCVAEHALANKYDKVIFITDGQASLHISYMEKLKTTKTKFLTILTYDPYTPHFKNNTKSYLKELGPVVSLKDIIKVA